MYVVHVLAIVKSSKCVFYNYKKSFIAAIIYDIICDS